MTRKLGPGVILAASIVLVVVLLSSLTFIFSRERLFQRIFSGGWLFQGVEDQKTERTPDRSALGSAPVEGAPGNPPQGPQRTVLAYGNWSVRCDLRYGNPPQKHCDLAQQFSAQRGAAPPVAQVMIERPNKQEPMRMVLQLQANAFMTPGVKFVYDDKLPALNLSFSRCFPNACFASGPLPEDVVKGLRGQTGAARVEFKDGGERDVTVPVSLNGFAAAFDAWTKE